jgi:hypothetical protein
MTDIVITDGDQAVFTPAFGAAIVVVRPGRLTGSGKSALSGKKICVEGDEKKLEVPGCAYVTPQFIIPGTGTLKIAALGADQLTKKSKDEGKAIVLKGSVFTAVFEVQNPAKDPSSPPPKPDPVPKYSGTGQLVSFNLKFKAD